jgi:hypothetical protein
MEYTVYNSEGQLVGYCDEDGVDALVAEGLCCIESENIATDLTQLPFETLLPCR